MRLKCPNCPKVYTIPDDRIPPEAGVSFPCPACKSLIPLSPSNNLALKADNKAGSRTGNSNNRDAEIAPRCTQTKQAGPLTRNDSEQEAAGDALRTRVLKTVGDLPPMPQTVHKARDIMANSNSSFRDLAIVLVADQAIATRVLKIANSAYYGLSGKVSSIQHASVVLGQKTLAEILTLASTSKLMGQKLAGYGLSAEDQWRHSLSVAFGARIVANKKNPGLEDNAFSAGLIHDAGKLVLDKYILEKKALFDQLVAECKSEGIFNLTRIEQKLLGLDHAEIGGEVCKKWNVPNYLAVAIQSHHAPSALEENELGHMVHVADILATASVMSQDEPLKFSNIDEKSYKVLRLKEEELPKIMAQLISAVEKTMSHIGD